MRTSTTLTTILLLTVVIAPTAARAQQPIEQLVADALCGNQVVVLGELPSHGEARAFEAKARIVEELINRCGFTTLLFEAPIYDFLGFQKSIEIGRATPGQLDQAIGGFWLTKELRPWRKWLFSRASDKSLRLGGLDDQVSATSFFAREALPDLVSHSVQKERAEKCRETVVRNLYWQYDEAQPFDEPEQSRLQECSRWAADAEAARTRVERDSPEQVMLENLANLYARQVNPDEARDRDEMMYQNFRWHHDGLEPQGKIIVWTATVHSARRQGGLDHKPFGTWLSEQWEDQLAVLGFTAFAGHSSMAGMPSKPIPEAPPGSLEARAASSDTSWIYLDAPALREMGAVPSRLLGRFTVADWSMFFDGVLVIREEKAPVFEPK